MCVLLCANSNFREWAEISLAKAYRQSLQLCPVSLGGAYLSISPQGSTTNSTMVSDVKLDEGLQRRVMKRSAWVQAYWRYRVARAQRGKRTTEYLIDFGLSREWQVTFETIAKTWGRLLALVGLRG